MNTICGGKAHFEFRPIVLRTHQAQFTAMQACQFARQVKADAVARCRRGTRAVVETFEDVFPGWNRTASVADPQHYVFAIATCADSNSPPRPIVLSRVLQKILHDERRVAFLASHQKSAGK